jgi:hypothetical protein
MRSWYRLLLGGLLVVAVAAAGIGLNFALLGMTESDGDRVGKLSPRAVFERSTGTTGTASPTTSPGTSTSPETDTSPRSTTAPETTSTPSTTGESDDRTVTDGDSHGRGRESDD